MKYLVLGLTLILFSSLSWAQIPAAFVGDEILIKFKNSANESKKSQVLNRLKGKNKRKLKSQIHQVQIHNLQSVESAIDAYMADPDVEFAEPNFIMQAMATANDPLMAQQWGLKNTAQTVNATQAAALVPGFTGWFGTTWNAASGAANPGTSGADINAETAWNSITDCRTNKDGTPILVGVIDSGVNYNHPDISNNMWNGGASFPKHGKNLLSTNTNGDVMDADDPMDQGGHGTAIAGIIAATGNNGIGTSGVCWRANIMALKALSWQETGSVADVSAAIDFAVANGAKVANLSLGMRVATSATLEASVSAAKNAGVLLVTASGNDSLNNESNNMLPCNYSVTYDNVLCVGAVDSTNALGAMSAYGITKVQIGAPGVNIVSISDGLNSVINTTRAADGAPAWTTTGADATAGPWSFAAFGVGGSYPSGGVPSETNYILQIGTVTGSFTFQAPSYNINTTSSSWSGIAESRSRNSIYDIMKFCYYKIHNLASGDQLKVAYSTTGAANPFSGANTVYETLTGNGGTMLCQNANTCLDNTCSFGFQLVAGANGVSSNGAIFTHIKYTHKTPDSAGTTLPTTNIASGTSDAAAFVTGVAAMLYASNGDNFTYLDVKQAILSGGTSVGALSDKFSSGKALNALGAISFIKAPTGVTATSN